MSPTSAALAALALVVFRALALSAEAALAATSSEALREREASQPTLDAFGRLKARPEATFATLRAVLIVTLTLAATFGAVAGAAWLTPWASQRMGAQPAVLLGPVLGGLLTALFAMVLDLAARALAGANAVGVTCRAVAPVLWLTSVLSPPLALLAGAVDIFVRPFGAKARFGPPRPPLEDIERLLVEEANNQGLDPQGPKFIRNIFEMSEKVARDVMVPRTRVVALDLATPAAEILQVLAEHGHSRMPVYTEEIDNIVGILHARDLVPMLQHPELIVLHDIIRPASFIPWSKPVGDILREMQKKKIHMALVVDEYGGLLGVVTLEDVLEVIVGDIQDEYDDELPEVEPLADGSFLVRASVPVDSFNRHFSVEIPDGDYETLGGFLNFLAGCIPESGDKFFYSGLQFSVQDRTPRRVRRVRVQRVAAGAAAPDGRRKREPGSVLPA